MDVRRTREALALDRLEGLRGPLLAFLRHHLWESADLEDAVQDVAVAVLARSGDFEEGTNFRAWVLRIALHCARNRNRRHAARRRGRRAAEEAARTSEAVDPAETLAEEWTYDQILSDPDAILGRMGDEVRRAVLALPEAEREALLLRVVGDLAYREIAAVLEIPLGSAMGYIGRARARLRERLARYAREVGFLRPGGGP